MPPSTADLRRFFVDTFDAEELKVLCFDYFRDVYDDFTTGMTKTQMIYLLIERCVRRDALANLEATLAAERPEQYEKRFGPPAPTAIPAEPASAPGTLQSVQPTAPVLPIPVPAIVSIRGPIAFDWVTIPAGEFLMGSDKTKDRLAFDDETPQHTLHLPSYRIASVPVTVAQFAAFMAVNPEYHTTAERQSSAWICTGSKWEEVAGADWAHPRGPKSLARAQMEHPVMCIS
jgi:formylglycine-generating enzyme required for sulfatase activity